MKSKSPGVNRTPQAVEKLECEFVGPEVLSQRLKSVLSVSAGDVPVLDTTGNSTREMRIASNSATLGKGDLSQGRPDDLSCATPKFKAAIEVMFDACAIALKDPQVKQRLFPSGAEDPTQIYKTLLGRKPTSYETQVVKDLLKVVSSEMQAPAVCAAVSGSLESLIKI